MLKRFAKKQKIIIGVVFLILLGGLVFLHRKGGE